MDNLTFSFRSNFCLFVLFRGTSTPIHQPIPPAMALNSSTTPPSMQKSFEDQKHSTPLRRSSSPNLQSPTKRLFHSPPLTASAKSPQPPRPSSLILNPDGHVLTQLKLPTEFLHSESEGQSADPFWHSSISTQWP